MNKNHQIKKVILPFKEIIKKKKRNNDQKYLLKYIKELEETNRELDAIFKFSHDGIFVSDGNGIGIRYNDSYCRITGIDAEKLMGIQPQKYMSDSATLKVLKSRKQETTMPVLESGKKVLITSNPVFDKDGNIIRVIANARDMTELINLKSQIEEVKELSNRYYSEILHLRSQDVKIKGMVAESSVMKDIVETALKIAAREVTVLITGDSGTGKEVLARTIHENSEVKGGPFVKVNCGSIPENLLESELFGYEKGAFTSASKSGKTGIFEIAIGGTLFLDEIGELPLALQAKLLGVLQDMKFTRVGGTKEICLNARVIAATNRNLAEMIREKKFRKDLFYRLNVVGLKIPSLNERKDDIFPLANYFIKRLNKKYKTANTLSHGVINAFISYDWPGNIREMENLLERLVVLAPNEQITMSMLPDYMVSNVDFKKILVLQKNVSKENGLKTILDNVERKIFEKLIADGYNSYKMANLLGINQSTIVRKIKKLGLKINTMQYD
ncbi:MAG: sigma 54-interacting transcriptional regulator [Veillonellales bacterium]